LPVTSLPRISELTSLPPTDATLFVPGRRGALPDDRSAELSDWVRRGGHLIVVAWTIWDEDDPPDPILDPLGIRQFKHEPQRPTSVSDWAPTRGAPPLRVSFQAEFSMELEGNDAPPVWTAQDDEGTHAICLPLGAGHVTVLTDDDFLQNTGIGELDHAELLYRWVRQFGHSGATWIVRMRSEPIDLWARFWKHGWAIAVALAAWLAFHVWSRAPRFGPVLPDPVPARRELMEHVQAAGHFLLRHGAGASLLGAVRAALQRRLELRHPQWRHLPAAEQARCIAEWTGEPPEGIAALLAPDPTQTLSPASFASQVARLESLRRKL
jgi:hypothetical protein